ncbi:fibropellin-3-like isoform X30 [Mytilus californianus]|uniref:fibropellin-3-like isoform X1 n=1 Tax=Mytilus californianus TaxID=6549 RepID=UPI00224657DC|nr:fibropellin-3-like isoform X1 [Mytilus californianus]XP_052064157.1 fibropellin-3-like isoform X2 [Mytilus californianus]XP_052064160.1 fibropellin-3-like isoform X3 [Mytilus californianus]XP_052064169.1 fibropellin-3-like isoform X4 [Mytilus californianus]XP_052064179.1 fibropellin-3-like isoform X5 [Mytilus californianus]XP_052064188.1 fibropellin-3-like isoform X6 [Mytilus californianus]XP_052064198.1 fibropellin-3-like isoform X7 [Mytilus californianus]XP_052064207.1 fibropellin-3-lik
MSALGVLLWLVLSTKASPCEYVQCLHDGNCSVSGDKAICNCHTGFNGLKCEGTPCVNYSCANGGTCFLHEFQPKCACKNGFTGASCTITPCSRSPCEHAGTCSVIGSSFSCACLNGFTGLQCESTPCVRYSCFNGGTCFLDKFQPNCACKNGFTGDHCKFPPRKHAGNCSMKGSNVTCICLNGFAGLHCEIYVADFENSLDSMFIQDLDDDYNWKVHSNATLSTSTGPSTAYKGNYYLYFETSSPVKEGSTARLVSRDFMFESSGCLKFHYHMHGSSMGTLNVYLGSRQIWRKTGNQGNKWTLAKLDLQSNSFNSSKIYFEAVCGTSHTSDIAIDDVEVHPSRC